MVTGERNYTVKLMLQSSPAPTLYTWTFNGSLLSSGDGITLGADFITFAVVSERISGEYTVSGSNQLGTGTANFSVVVLPFPAITSDEVTQTMPTTEAVSNISATPQTTVNVTDMPTKTTSDIATEESTMPSPTDELSHSSEALNATTRDAISSLPTDEATASPGSRNATEETMTLFSTGVPTIIPRTGSS